MTDSPKKGMQILFIALAVIFAVYIFTFEADDLFSTFKLEFERSGITEEFNNIQGAFQGLSNIDQAVNETLFGAGDFDQDGLDNRIELLLGSNAALNDSDEDGKGDLQEFLEKTDLGSAVDAQEINPQFIEKRVRILSDEGFSQAEEWASLYYLERLKQEDLKEVNNKANLYLDLAHEYNQTESFFLDQLPIAYQEGKNELALIIATRYHDNYPENPDTLFHKGFAFQQVGQIEQAQALYEQAIEAGSELPALYNNLAILAQERGDIQLAKEYYDKAIKLAPENPVYQQNRAMLDQNT